MSHVKIVFDAEKDRDDKGSSGNKANPKKKIIFVDDSRTSAYVTKKMLSQLGHEVEHFTKAESALDAIMEQEFDLLITDLMLSGDQGMNGDDLIRLVRLSGHPQNSNIPIIVVTGSTDEEKFHQLQDAGADGVLGKPLELEPLDKLIRELTHIPEDAVTLARTTAASSSQGADSSQRVLPGEPLFVKAEQASADKHDDKKTLVEHLSEFDDIPTLTSIVKSKKNKPSLDEAGITEEGSAQVTNAEEQERTWDTETPSAAFTMNQNPFASYLEKDEAEESTEHNGFIDYVAPDNSTSDSNNVVNKESTKQATSSDWFESLLDSQGIGAPEKQMTVDDTVSTPSPETRSTDKTAISVDDISLSSIGRKKTKIEVSQPESIAKPVSSNVAAQSAAPPAAITATDNPLMDLLDKLDEKIPSAQQSSGSFASKPQLSINVEFLKQRNVIIGAALIVVMTLAGFLFSSGKSIDVKVQQVSRGDIHQSIAVPGFIVTDKKINITPFFPGQLSRVFVKEGQKVGKSDLLAKLDGREIDSKVNRAQANLISIKEEVALSSKTLKRLQKALNIGAVSRQRVEDAEASWKSASAKQSVAEEELKEAKLMRERLEIRAPFDGIVTSLSAQSGQWISPPDPLMTLVNLETREIELKVDSADASALNMGQKVNLKTGSFGGQEWTETIRRISSTTRRENSVNSVSVYVSLGSDAPDLRIGQQVDAEIRLASAEQVLRVPLAAVKQIKGQKLVGIPLNGKIHYIPVTTGLENFSHVEIKDGLKEAQEVVVSEQVLEEGESINIINIL